MKKKVTLLFLCFVFSITILAQNKFKLTIQQRQYGMTWANWTGKNPITAPIIQWMLDEYNTLAPAGDSVSPVFVDQEEIQSKLLSTYMQKTIIDIAEIELAMFPSLATIGRLTDLTPLLSKDYLEKTFFAGSIQATQYNNVQYALPWTIQPRTLIANTKILTEAGVTFEIITITDFEKALELVKTRHPLNMDSNANNDILPYAAITTDIKRGAEDFMAWAWTFGANVFDKRGQPAINSKEGVQALTWYKKLVENNYMYPVLTQNEACNLFKNQKAAFIEASYSDAALLGINPTATTIFAKPLPRPVLKKGNPPQTVTTGDILVVMNNSGKTLDAAKFTQFINSYELSLEYFKKHNILPVNRMAFEDTVIKKSAWAYSWKPILSSGRIAETSGIQDKYLNSVIAEELVSALNGTKQPSIAILAMNNRLRR